MARLQNKDFHEQFAFSCMGLETMSSDDQIETEKLCREQYSKAREFLLLDPRFPSLHRELHIGFLKKGLTKLSSGYECLEASQPWLVYWILHGLELLGEAPDPQIVPDIIQFLNLCQCPDGGFAGSPGQKAHLATTYAAVNASCILGTEEAFSMINRATLCSFLMRQHQADGSFLMHEGGEKDIRGVYCALSAAKLCHIHSEEMFSLTAEWVVSCQTYEGGFGGVPGMEAHGGYSFCGLASLVMLGRTRLADLSSLTRWLASRQMRYEGGFQGRTNKLVDACYSFWQGGALPLLHIVAALDEEEGFPDLTWLFCRESLQEYLLVCCQHRMGGLIDKPGKHRDFYHTCYALSGLSVAQHFDFSGTHCKLILGCSDNELIRTHPVYNICIAAVEKSQDFFQRLTPPVAISELE